MSNMVIRTNVLSLNSHRNLGLTGTRQARASSRLSSGFRINSAADDAAGLGISEKMRGQIRGLDQASRNAQDGISLIQTAEGAMQTVNDIVIRIRELVVQAANDTNVHEDGNVAQSDRARIQDEINQLLDEVDQIAYRTEFNTRTLLNGDWGTGAVVPMNIPGATVNGPAPDAPVDSTAFTTEDAIRWSNLWDGGPTHFAIVAPGEHGNVFELRAANDVTLRAGFRNVGAVDLATRQAAFSASVNAALRSLVNYEGTTAEGMNAAVANWLGEQGIYSASTVVGEQMQTFHNLFADGIVGSAHDNYDAQQAVIAHLNENVNVQGIVERVPALTPPVRTNSLFDFSTNNIRIHADAIAQFDDIVGATNAARAALASFMTQAIAGFQHIPNGATATDGFLLWLAHADSGNLVVNADGSLATNAGGNILAAPNTPEGAVAGEAILAHLQNFLNANPGKVTADRLDANGVADYFELDLSGHTTGGSYVATAIGAAGLQTGAQYVEVNGFMYNIIVAADEAAGTATITINHVAPGLSEDGLALREEMIAYINNAMLAFADTTEEAPQAETRSLWFHIGANENQGVNLHIENVSVEALGLSQLRTSTAGNARIGGSVEAQAVTGFAGVMIESGEQLGSGEAGWLAALDRSLAHVTSQRSILGAMQNRLEFSIENLDIASENLQAANSRIRDADMAREMMTLTQMNVLQQAATAMLAQANQAPQMVLQLLG